VRVRGRRSRSRAFPLPRARAALTDDVLGVISSVAERVRLRSLTATPPGPSWDCLLFRAKESVCKAWHPSNRQWPGFEEVEVTVSPSDGCVPRPDNRDFSSRIHNTANLDWGKLCGR
jgi:4'-phosphopantetheinyl transferase EntD